MAPESVPPPQNHTRSRPVARPRVSVIIPHYNDLDHLRECLGRLRLQTWPADRMEIIIADNNSRCGIAAVRELAEGCTVIPAPIQGAGPARNAAIAAAGGDVLALLDSDCMAAPDWLEKGVAGLELHDFAGGTVVTTCADPARPTAVEAFEMVFNFNFKRYITKVGFTGTGNMFVWRNVFDLVGGFRAGVSEDIDWSYRARAMGFTLGHIEGAVVSHPARRDWDELERRWRRLVSEHVAFCRSDRWRTALHVLRGLAMPLSIPAHAWKVIRSDRLPHWPARWGAIGVLFRLRLWRMREILVLTARGPPAQP